MNHPLNPTFKTEWLPILLAAITVLFSFYFYAHFPERVVTHWNFSGQPDGYGGRTSAAFGLAAIIPALYVLMMVFPYLDPRRERYVEFRSVYLSFRTLLMFVMLAVYVATGLWNVGYPVQINHVVPFIIGLMFLFLGNYMGKIKPNWFFGIRTPWTLSSENVWNRTHRLGGWMFVLFGLAIMVSPYLSPTLGFGVFIAGVFIAVFGTVVYSYVIYRQEKRQHPPEQLQG